MLHSFAYKALFCGALILSLGRVAGGQERDSVSRAGSSKVTEEHNAERDRMKAISEAEKFNFEIKFPWDKFTLNPDYLTNRIAFDSLRSVLQTLRVEDSVQVVVTGQASPEGTVAHNNMLSINRAAAIERYVKENYEGAVVETRVRTAGDSWAMLREYVVKDKLLSEEKKAKVLRIIDDPSVGYDTKNWRMSHTLGSQPNIGDVYAYLYRNYYKHIRRSNISLERMNPIEVFAIPPITPYYSKAYGPEGQLAPRAVYQEEEVNKKTIVALKTNLLYDAVTALNFAVEVPFGEHFSVLYEHHCPWWLTENNKYCLQLLTFGGEARWWFAPKTKPETSDRKLRDALVGHYLGVYAFGGKSDIQAGRDFGCYQTEPFSAGLSYGYSLPVSKYLNLEFSLSAGYARIPYQHYIPTPDWKILIRDRDKAGTLHYFGPTKAEISLVIPIRVQTASKGGKK